MGITYLTSRFSSLRESDLKSPRWWEEAFWSQSPGSPPVWPDPSVLSNSITPLRDTNVPSTTAGRKRGRQGWPAYLPLSHCGQNKKPETSHRAWSTNLFTCRKELLKQRNVAKKILLSSWAWAPISLNTNQLPDPPALCSLSAEVGKRPGDPTAALGRSPGEAGRHFWEGKLKLTGQQLWQIT